MDGAPPPDAGAGPSRGGRPPHQPTADTRAQVVAMATYGCRRDQICVAIGIDHKTLLKHYPDELRRGDMAAEIAHKRTMYQRAIDDGVPSLLIWLDKTRFGAREVQTHEHSGPNGDRIKVETSDARARLADFITRVASAREA